MLKIIVSCRITKSNTNHPNLCDIFGLKYLLCHPILGSTKIKNLICQLVIEPTLKHSLFLFKCALITSFKTLHPILLFSPKQNQACPVLLFRLNENGLFHRQHIHSCLVRLKRTDVHNIFNFCFGL